jgi:hypothetical protein
MEKKAMVETALVFDPTAPGGNEPQQFRRRLDTLTGKVVGFIDNAKPNFNYLADDLAELLVGKYGVKTIIRRRKRGASIPADVSVVQELSAQCDLVITGSGD